MKKNNDLKILFPEDVFVHCRSCGKCCQHWPITIEEDKYKDLVKTDFYKDLQAENPESCLINFNEETCIGTIAKTNTKCIMLRDNLCLIHSELGPEAKSYCCRTFPLVFGILPGELYVGVSYYCPSVQANEGKPIKDYLPLVRKLAEIGVKQRENPETARLTGEVNISWEAYLCLENFIKECITQSGAPMGTWQALSAVAAFDIIKTDREEFSGEKEEVEDFFTCPVPVIMERSPEFVDYQMEFCAHILAIAESGEALQKDENSKIILNGGNLKSSTFDKVITIRPLWEYMSAETPVWIYNEFIKYFDNVIWRKQILPFNSIFSGLVFLHFLPIIISWYANAAAIVNGREAPEQEDLREALGIVDLYFNHMIELHDSFEVFADEMMENIMRFFEFDDDEISE